MPQNSNSAPGLDAIAGAVLADPGLRANASRADIREGAEAARLMNDVIETAIRATGVNRDGRLDPDDLRKISDFIRADDALFARFVEGHGDDAGQVETGFHLVQGDGGSLRFQGKNFVDTIADAIYHVGFDYRNGRFENEDGNANERVDDVAGWLNYFVNGENVVYGSGASETLYSAPYGDRLADAADEVFLAGAGNDFIWAKEGDDEVHGGSGHDKSAGGAGDDTLLGDRGNDSLYGESGDDSIAGGAGRDILGGGDGDDRMRGGAQNDKLYGNDGDDNIGGQNGNDTISAGSGDDTVYGGAGNDGIWGDAGNDLVKGGSGHDRLCAEDGNDTVFGGSGNDTVNGHNGNDELSGGDGVDTINGGAGRDTIDGGAGADILIGWGRDTARDTFVFEEGDSGTGRNDRDVIKGFKTGIDRIDLSAYDDIQFRAGDDFSGRGRAEVLFDGDFIQIDDNGDGRADSSIEMEWINRMTADDFIF